MKISRTWLQQYFDVPLPEQGVLADALTFHAFEIESIEEDILDVKITANRGHDCLSHRGIAEELAAILDIPLKADPLAVFPELGPKTDELRIRVDEPALCKRYIGAYIRGVKIGPSPEWLAKRLESIGQKSINNVVDAANFVMFDLGQPLHAFDAKKRSKTDGAYAIAVRLAHVGETLITLDDKEQMLAPSMLMIADGTTDEPLGVAGVKGGKESGVSDTTTDLILESANFDGPSLRKTSRALKFRTDATQRFEQVVSPELAAFGMQAFVELVLDLAGGELVGYAEAYPERCSITSVSVANSHINQALGLELTDDEIESAFKRLGFACTRTHHVYDVTIPFERLDIAIAEDLIEEVGRIIGYDKVPAIELPAPSAPVEPNENVARFAAVREHLASQGFSEVYTSVFVEKGERAVSNKIGGDKPYLRANLSDGLADALERNVRIKDLFGARQVKLFEIGTVWAEGKERIDVAIAVEKQKKTKTQEEYADELAAFEEGFDAGEHEPAISAMPDVRYEPFSRYPFISRDIALWVPTDTTADDVLAVIRAHAGELLVRSEKFDEFAKDGRVSFAFRLVFQSMDRTLFDEDANARMESIYAAVKEKGWEVR